MTPEPDPAIRPWEVVSELEEADFGIFRVRRRIARNPRTGGDHRIVQVRSPDWVNVIALTPQGEVVLVEQYRHGIERVTLEIPGGMIEPGESPAQAGARELREETGYAGAPGQLLGQGHPNPAFLSNTWCTVLVREARQVGQLQLEGGEDIAVRLVPLAEIPGLIRAGTITHALVIAGFHWLALSGA